MIKSIYYTKRAILALVFLLLFQTNKASGQWSYYVPITITNNESVLVTNYQVPLYYNTATPVTALQMSSTGDDIRFSTACTGGSYYNYYIDSGMNSAATKMWVLIDTLLPNQTKTIYMLYGNATATAASTLNTFNGPYSATDQVASGGAGGATNSQRGFRFSPNHKIIISQFGKREPNGSTRYVTIFDFNTQAIVQQAQVAGPAATYSYSNLSSPIWLNKNQQYLLQLYQGATDGYYFGTSSQINSNLTYSAWARLRQ